MHAHHCAPHCHAADSTSAEAKTEPTSAGSRCRSRAAAITTPRDRAHLTRPAKEPCRGALQGSPSISSRSTRRGAVPKHTPKRGTRALRAPQRPSHCLGRAATQTVRSEEPGRPPHRGAVAARHVQGPETSLGRAAESPLHRNRAYRLARWWCVHRVLPSSCPGGLGDERRACRAIAGHVPG
jgi:hypothetical protein